jgi:tetrapyrrole methylase family protein/MazG family protein
VENSKIIQDDSFLDALVRLVASLRGENGCPWDQKQTPDSVALYLIEEVFELVEAIEKGDRGDIREELGDVLFHIVFIARMFEEDGQFDLQDVAEGITHKMIRRHPHVFGDWTVSGSEEVIQNWHKIKQQERQPSQNASIFDSVPASLPSLMRAYRISDRAAKSGIEWTELAGQVHTPEYLSKKLKTAAIRQDKNLQSQEFGQLLFALVNICRRKGIHPETALTGVVKQFERKVKEMQDLIADREQDLTDLSSDQKAQIWQKINLDTAKNPPDD